MVSGKPSCLHVTRELFFPQEDPPHTVPQWPSLQTCTMPTCRELKPTSCTAPAVEHIWATHTKGETLTHHQSVLNLCQRCKSRSRPETYSHVTRPSHCSSLWLLTVYKNCYQNIDGGKEGNEASIHYAKTVLWCQVVTLIICHYIQW